MISEDEVKQTAIIQGVTVAQIEKDYVMGWLLWGIYRNHVGLNLVLKGGNCLRKIYFPETRFSDDLDFTAIRFGSVETFKGQLANICTDVEKASGIRFFHDRLNVSLLDTPHDTLKALDGRVYFQGFAGDANVSFRIKFDVSEFEKIVLPVQKHNILHPYSDALACNIKVFSYSLEEVLAEKLRSWIQRTRSRDLYDLVRIIQSDSVTFSRLNVMKAFFKKSLFKNIPAVAKEELLSNEKFQIVESHWDASIVCSKAAMILIGNAVNTFKQFVELLFNSDVLLQLGALDGRMNGHISSRISAAIREPIINAGKARKLIRLKYDHKDRDIEPYALKYEIRKKDGNGFEYFYGWDRTRGNHIKKFFLHEIQAVSIINEVFTPKYPVEF